MRPNNAVPPKIAERRPSAVLAAVGLSLLVNLPCATASPAELLEERDFRLAKNARDHVVFSVAEAGMLVVRARLKRPLATAPIRLLLEGPGGLRVEKEGSAPLRLRYTIAAATTGETWRASVINTGRLPDVAGRLTVEIQHRSRQPAAGTTTAAGGATATAIETDVTDGKVSIIDDRRLRAVCRDRNSDVSVRLDLEQGTGALLMRFNHVFSFAARQLSEDRIEMRGSGQQPLYLDLAKKAIVFASEEDGAFCRVRIYRQGED